LTALWLCAFLAIHSTRACSISAKSSRCSPRPGGSS
jgi:hypothetical protein